MPNSQMNDGSRDLSVSLDAARMISGKFLTLSPFKILLMHKKEIHLHLPNCPVNYSGTRAGMKVEGTTKIFLRSLNTYNVSYFRYVNYLGGGDSKRFLKATQSKPYGNHVSIEKLECVAEVAKRMGTRWQKLKLTSTKLADGKFIVGQSKLTDTAMNTIQLYYGLAIKRNQGQISV